MNIRPIRPRRFAPGPKMPPRKSKFKFLWSKITSVVSALFKIQRGKPKNAKSLKKHSWKKKEDQEKHDQKKQDQEKEEDEES
jgi:hypothetical protein